MASSTGFADSLLVGLPWEKAVRDRLEPDSARRKVADVLIATMERRDPGSSTGLKVRTVKVRRRGSLAYTEHEEKLDWSGLEFPVFEEFSHKDEQCAVSLSLSLCSCLCCAVL